MANPASKLSQDRPGETPPPHPAGPLETTAPSPRVAEAFVIALILAIILRTFFIQAYKIPSGSMEPTLLIGDHIIVNKLIYGLRMPDSLFGLTPFAGEIPWGHYLFHFRPVHRGDVVVFVFPPDPTKDFIKRVIGIAGDTVQVKDGKVCLNGAPMAIRTRISRSRPAERSPNSPRDNFGPITVPAGQYFMMGDNRDRSYDGRFWGFVEARPGRRPRDVHLLVMGCDSQSFLGIRWSRFGMAVR